MRWLLILLLAGCQSAPVTIDRPVRVEVPVPVACLSSVPPRPATTDDQALQLLDDYRLVLTIWRDLLVLRGHVAALEALLAPCAAAPGL